MTGKEIEEEIHLQGLRAAFLPDAPFADGRGVRRGRDPVRLCPRKLQPGRIGSILRYMIHWIMSLSKPYTHMSPYHRCTQTNAVRPAPEARGNPLEQKAGKDHFDAMGFRKDGYDYSKHMKEMGRPSALYFL